MIPKFLRPTLHRVIDRIAAAFGLHLPSYFNIRIKLKYLLRGIDEPDIQYLSNRYLKKGDIVIDIGANIGLTSRAFARAVGKAGQVHSLEPERRNFALLCANTISFPQVMTHRLAIAATRGRRALHLNPVSGTGNSFFGSVTDQIQNVDCLTFDDFLAEQEISKPACVKIDVEGAELEVLQGMPDLLRINPNLLLLIELCPANLESAGWNSNDLLSRIQGMGFVVHYLKERGNSYHLERLKSVANALGVKPYINLVCARTDLVSGDSSH